MTNEEMREIQITREEIYDGIVLHVTKDTVRLPGGGTSVREVAWHRGAVCVVPLTEAGEIYFLEINTLPGMTPTSLVPREATAIGMSYRELCGEILRLSMDERKGE